jgi:hypothetical protein
MKMSTIDPNELYSPLEIEQLKFIPSRLQPEKFMARDTIAKLIEDEKKLVPYRTKVLKDGKKRYLVMGKTIIAYLKKYHPDYKIPLN